MDLSGQQQGAGRALRGERGQTSAEYVGIVLVVVAIIAAISAADIGAAISVQVERAVCQIAADGGAECQAGAGREERSGARARPAPNLYDAEATPRLAGLNARSPKFVATGASSQAATRTASFSPGDFLPPEQLVTPKGAEGVFGGPDDAKEVLQALAEGRYGEALVGGLSLLPLPQARVLRLGKEVVDKLGPQAKKLWKKLADERGSVGLPAARAARGPSLRESHRIARAARKRGVRILNARLAGTVYKPTGVRYKKSGFLDMTPFAQVINGTKNVRVKGLTGDNRFDQGLADEAAGFKKGKTPKGYTWHHVEDGKTMQLVPSNINRDTPHTGGAALLREGVVKPAK